MTSVNVTVRFGKSSRKPLTTSPPGCIRSWTAHSNFDWLMAWRLCRAAPRRDRGGWAIGGDAERILIPFVGVQEALHRFVKPASRPTTHRAG